MSSPGTARMALISALRSGARGTFDALAHHAGLHPEQAQATLKNLRREGVVVSEKENQHAGVRRGVGRPRAVYGPRECDTLGAFDALSYARQVWR